MRHDFIRLKVKEAMLKRNIKNVDIARILGTSEGYTSTILSGKATTTEDRWRVVCSALEIDMDAILEADLQHRLPGIQTVHAAWEALLAGESYEPCEILPEVTLSPAPAGALQPNRLQTEEKPLTNENDPRLGELVPKVTERAVEAVPPKTDEPLPVMDATVTKRKIFVALNYEEIATLIDGLDVLLLGCIPTEGKRPDLDSIRRLHEVTGLMVRLSEAV